MRGLILFGTLTTVDGFHSSSGNTWISSHAQHRLTATQLGVKVAGDKPAWMDEFDNSFWDDVKTTTAADLVGEGGGHPEQLCGEIQLEELEGETSTVSTLLLQPNGAIQYLATDGPLPTETTGEWSADELSGEIGMVITRTFVNENVGSTYSVTRILQGFVEGSPGFITASGEVRINDYPVGYFKVLVLASNVDAVRPTLDYQYV